MKLKIKLSLVFFIVINIFSAQKSFSQCPTIDYALINSCATGSTEGVNEFVVFTTTVNAATRNYELYYDNDSNAVDKPLNILSGENAREKNGTGTITSKNCSSSLNFVTSPSTIIPSGSKVVFIPSNFEQDYDFSILCSGVGIYVVYIDINASSPTPNWQAGGTFGNTPTSNRYLQITNGSSNCSSNVRIFDNGWSSDKDGNFVSWNGTGESAYGNNGCSFSLPPTINPGIVSEICFGSTTTTMPYTVTENPDKYTITWNTAALSSGFTNIVDGNLTTSPLTISISSSANPGTYTASLIVTSTTTGLSSSPQNISVKINAIPTLVVTPNNRCGEGVVELSALSSGTINWYNQSSGGASLATGNVFTTPSISETKIYWLEAKLGDCTSSRLPVSAIVNTVVIPTFDAIPTICQNATPPLLPNFSTNVPPISGTWNSVINTSALGTTEYTFTPNAGQCGTTTKLPVTVDSCGFGVFASAGWLANCNFPSGQFYNITGSGVDLINPSSPEGSFITNLGSYIQNSGALTFGGGEIKTFKAPTGNVCGATMFYNVHLQTDPAGIFTPLILDFFSDCNSGSFKGGGPCNDRDQKWQTVTSGLLDMTALSPGNYVLEVYYSVNGDGDSNSQCDDTKLINNNGLNYRSSFSIQGAPQYTSTNPSTCSGSEGTISISALLASTSYEVSYNDDAVAEGPITISSDASGVIVISGLNAGSYSNFVVKATCGSYTNNTPIVLINPELIASISKTDNSVCQSVTVPCNGSATLTPTGSGSYSYLWNDTLAQTSATATELCPGSYNVLVTDLVSLCNATKTITVGNTAVLPVITSLSKGTSPICSGSNAVFTINGTSGATVSYSINTEPAQTVVLNASGNAQVVVNQVASDITILLSQISLSSCSVTVANTDIVIVSTPPNAGIISGDSVICSNGKTTFSSTVSGGIWSSSDNSAATIDATSGEITVVSSGTATMTYTVAGTGGCTNVATEQRLVTISTTPVVTVSGRCIGKEYTLEAFPSSGVTYKWSQGTSPLLETKNKLSVKILGSYTVEINNSGCTAEATKNVTSFYCDIPKGISPNGDESNEYFDLSNLIVKKLEIFNRYGVKVYSKTNYKKEWDGKSDGGQELPDATYYYVIEEEGNTPITGWVYINR
ncbi:gliding motility-associated C-terminal domain-containing protein [Flavobacterium luteum]|uniref:Gliding motility-associated C-terminal domain-containing protein n=1 Tax=Flavobacterium luteum TaxID=2026654 RepID=A0A7J5AFY0_9FLAO|nr:gliding motility-associated C-terminal domain-containing protein [Flavobacterium luteum]KAB1156527.1 gliding motility-associated C-terminal domain-containing protein [Flavobacterium luteum]